MAGMTVGAGLLALGFCSFLAAVAVAAIWNEVRRREAEHETLRQLIGSGQPTDPALMDRLLSIAGEGTGRTDRRLKAAGLVVLSVAPGLALLGWIVNPVAEQWLVPLLGVAALVGCVGIGLLAASIAVEHEHRGGDASGHQPRNPVATR